MNILDTFFFMFQADTSAIKKGTDEGEASAKKLDRTLTDADKTADKLAQNFVTMAKRAASALASVLALGAIKTLVNDTAAHTTMVALQARALGENVQQVSAYQAAIIGMGATADDAVQTLGKLRESFIEVARFGTAGVSPITIAFQQLGASAQTMRDSIKDPTIALSAIADKFSQLGNTQQLFIGEKLGLDQGTIALLAQGRRAFDELIAKEKELHAVTEEQARASMKYTIAQKELGLTFEAVKRDIVQEILPAFTWFVQRIDLTNRWLREHKAVATTVFAAIGAVVATVLIPPLITAAGALWALIAPALLAAAPFIALGLAIGLVADDLEKYRAGQKSVIGDIMEKWPAAGNIMRAVFHNLQADLTLLLTTLKSVWDYLAAMLEFFSTVFTKGPGAALDTLNKKTSQIFDNMTKAARGFKDSTKEIFNAVSDAWNARVPEVKAPSEKSESAARLGNTATGKEIADRLVASGKWTPEQAAGIAGSFLQESGGRADAKNPLSSAYGLGQWTTPRQKDFEKWAGHPLQGSSLDEQIQFFNHEVTNGNEKSAGNRLRAATTAAQAAEVHSRYYERPGAHEANIEKRQAYANAILAQQTLKRADAEPLAQPGSTAINNATTTSTRSTSVQTGPINIHTQAASADSISSHVADMLKQHINNAIDHHDDGIAG